MISSNYTVLSDVSIFDGLVSNEWQGICKNDIVITRVAQYHESNWESQLAKHIMLNAIILFIKITLETSFSIHLQPK